MIDDWDNVDFRCIPYKAGGLLKRHSTAVE
jgi:hypothetical protein